MTRKKQSKKEQTFDIQAIISQVVKEYHEMHSQPAAPEPEAVTQQPEAAPKIDLDYLKSYT
jgi:hypothetical protein